jgi:hypothetical protein
MTAYTRTQHGLAALASVRGTCAVSKLVAYIQWPSVLYVVRTDSKRTRTRTRTRTRGSQSVIQHPRLWDLIFVVLYLGIASLSLSAKQADRSCCRVS